MANEQQDRPRPRKAPAAAAAEHAPWMPTPFEPGDQLAIQRLAAGEANPIEQKRALAWIMKCTDYLGEPFRPGGDDGRRNTDYALGRAYVGRQIAKLLNVKYRKVEGQQG